MPQVFLNLGSNIEREYHLRAGVAALTQGFGELTCSSVYESDAVGFAGDAFLNMGVGLATGLPIGQLAAQLRQLEYAFGRPLDATRFSDRTLDIDIVLYDDLVGDFAGTLVPRPELLENAFFLAPMAELAPALAHPVTGKIYSELWRVYDRDRQPLRIVDIAFD